MSGQVPQPKFRILYNSADITRDVSESLISLRYADKVEGESDELELTMDDARGLWRDAWYPDKGATVQAFIGWREPLMNCGTFEVDGMGFGGGESGDTITMRCIAAGFTSSIRTKRSSAHENKTLAEIARTIAAKHGMNVIGITKDVTIERVTQLRKTDLSFLKKLSADYGYIFSVRDKTLVFTLIYELEQAASAAAIDRTDLTSYTLDDNSFRTYKSAVVKYNNPVDGATVEGGSNIESEGVTTADTLEIRGKAENRQQAEEQATSALYRANTKQQEGSITLTGNPAMIAGNNFDLTGMGKLSGKFHIISSEHAISKDGSYITTATIKRLAAFTGAQKTPKSLPNTKKQPATVNRLAPAAPIQNPVILPGIS